MLGGQDLVCTRQGWVDCKWQVPDCDPDDFVHQRPDSRTFSLPSPGENLLAFLFALGKHAGLKDGARPHTVETCFRVFLSAGRL